MPGSNSRKHVGRRQGIEKKRKYVDIQKQIREETGKIEQEKVERQMNKIASERGGGQTPDSSGPQERVS